MSEFNDILAKAIAEQNKVTNADRIRHMTDEDLAEFLADKTAEPGEFYRMAIEWLKWLQQEAKE